MADLALLARSEERRSGNRVPGTMQSLRAQAKQSMETREEMGLLRRSAPRDSARNSQQKSGARKRRSRS